jgi:hypothetical protein
MRPTINFSAAFLLLVSVIGFAHLRSRRVLRREVEQAARREGSLPKRILWIWERPEDLRELDPSSTGIAVLEETLHLGYSMTPVARHQAILLPDRTANADRALPNRPTRWTSTAPRVVRYAAGFDRAAALAQVVRHLQQIALTKPRSRRLQFYATEDTVELARRLSSLPAVSRRLRTFSLRM